MGLFKNFKKEDNFEDNSKVNWKHLNQLEDLDTIAEASKIKTQVIFKHSTRCGVSRMVLRQFEKDYNQAPSMDLYYLDLLNYRELSNAIAERFEVYHQSPQLLIIRNGVVVRHESHNNINAVDLKVFI